MEKVEDYEGREPDRTLILYANKNMRYIIGIYECIGPMISQTTNGEDDYVCKDAKGLFRLRARRGTYRIKIH